MARSRGASCRACAIPRGGQPGHRHVRGSPDPHHLAMLTRPGLGRADTTRTRGISQRDRLPSAHPALLLQGRRQNGSHLLLNQRLTAHVDRGSAVEGRIGRRAVHRHKSGFMPGEEPLAETSIRLVRIRAATYPVGEPAAPASHFCCGPSRADCVDENAVGAARQAMKVESPKCVRGRPSMRSSPVFRRSFR